VSVQFGSVQSGFSVSSAFQLNRSQRALQLGVASHTGQAWFLAFTVSSGGPFARVVPDPALAGNPAAVFSGTNGGWGVFVWPPTAEVRIETATNVVATTSFAIIEVAAGR
jgi:hypothetical protein